MQVQEKKRDIDLKEWNPFRQHLTLHSIVNDKVNIHKAKDVGQVIIDYGWEEHI